MIRLEEGTTAGLAFFYPYLSGKRRPIPIVPWSRYGWGLRSRATTNVLLFALGCMMLSNKFYTDSRFEIYSTSVVFLSCVRLFFFLPTKRIHVTAATRKTLVPWCALDYAGTFIVLAVMFFAFYRGDPELHLGELPVWLAVFFLAFASFQLSTALAYWVGLQKKV
jgi:hypothetical protein